MDKQQQKGVSKVQTKEEQDNIIMKVKLPAIAMRTRSKRKMEGVSDNTTDGK